MNELEQKSIKIKETATKIINDSNLINILGRYGEPRIVGSYKYDLMINRDIDIYLVVSEQSRKTAIKILNGLIEQNWWNNFEFGDFYQDKFYTPKWHFLPKGYYLQVKSDFNEKRWKVDIWMVSPDQYSKYSGKVILIDGTEFSMESLSKDQKNIILLLKNACKKAGIKTSGPEIYDSVINKGISNIEDFLMLKKHKMESNDEENTT